MAQPPSLPPLSLYRSLITQGTKMVIHVGLHI